jgi:integrase
MQRSVKIGRFGERQWNTDTARLEAQELRLQIDKGGDPAGERKGAKKAPTFDDLCERYLEDHADAKKRTADQDRALIKTYLKPAWGKKKANHIGRHDVEQLHRKISTTSLRKRKGRKPGSPIQANRMLALVHKMFALAVRWKIVETNPAEGVEKNREHRRERYLDADERKRLDGVLATYDNSDAVDAVRLALLTGARRGEILGARFDQFDLKGGVWSKPASTTKQQRPHRVPLSREVVRIVKERAKARGKAATLFDEEAFDLRDHWDAILKGAEIKNLRFHDLRHDFASRLVSRGRSLPLVGALLGHSDPRTTQRYAHLFDEPMREAVEELATRRAKKTSKA